MGEKPTRRPSMSVEPREADALGADPQPTPEEVFRILAGKTRSYMGEGISLAPLEKAYRFAAERHGAQTRHSGAAYITHPLSVATILTTLRVDMDSLVAAILHDVVEDTPTTLEEISREFGPAVASLVDGLTKIARISFRSNQERLAENFRKMVLAMAKDLRVILIKLADRLHNMQTLMYCAEDKRHRIAQETLDIYAPLANRLGIYDLKSQLEDLCLRQLHRDVYFDIRRKIATRKVEREAHVQEVKTILENELRRYGFKNFSVSGRPKHFYSIYKKMIDRKVEFEDIHDLIAFRIIVESVKDCYEALGIVHAMWKPMPGRFKDYIAMPKANLYQSLHTTVIRPSGDPAEIQIRTQDMNNVCEFGVATHWAYKEKRDSSTPSQNPDLQKFSWMRQMMAWQSELQDPDEFLEAVKVDLFQDEIFVFTPQGDVLELPAGAMPLDFAFAVHTKVGLHTMGAKINGRIVPLKTVLRSGDIVEILTSQTQNPTKDWLQMVTTSKARNKIRSFLRSEQRDKGRVIGRELLDQALVRLGSSLEKVQKTGDIDSLVKSAKEGNLDDMLITLGYGRLHADELIERALPTLWRKTHQSPATPSTPSSPTGPAPGPRGGRNKDGVSVSGIDSVLVNFGRCCNPLPGEAIVGFVTRGRGVTVHRSSCPRAGDMDPRRKIDVHWTSETSTRYHAAYLKVTTRDRPGILAEVSTLIARCGANIKQAQVHVSPHMDGVLEFELGIHSFAQLQAIIAQIENLHDVVSVERRNLLKSS